jgi:hypothetical protein
MHGKIAFHVFLSEKKTIDKVIKTVTTNMKFNTIKLNLYLYVDTWKCWILLASYEIWERIDFVIFVLDFHILCLFMSKKK